MKFTVAVLVGIFALAIASPGQEKYLKNSQVDESDILKQEKIVRLFKHTCQKLTTEEQHKTAQYSTIEDNVADYNDKHAVETLLKMVHKGMLPPNEIFSVFNHVHLKQAIALFKVLYSAKDFETFYQTALWARNHVNQGMFVYALSVAVLNRDDTENIILPAIYEIKPHYFVNTRAIQKAQQYKQQLNGAMTQEEYVMTVMVNHTGSFINVHPEQALSYFTEDVGINAFYYQQNLKSPFWMDAEEFDMETVARGEEFYYLHQQLLARYYLERLSNAMGDIKTINYDQVIETGFTPNLRYPNGLAFPERPNYAKLWEVNDDQTSAFNGKYVQTHTLVKDMQRRIRDAIDSGIILGQKGQPIELFTVDGFNKLGNLIESNPQSENNQFYGNLQLIVRQLLGFAKQPLSQYKLVPSALEHFETSLRDPAFWQMYKKIVLYFQHYNQQVPEYTYDELNFEGVKVQSVEVDRLITFFDHFDFDITNALYLNKQEMKSDNVQINARQHRLNHKAFNYKINVVSDKTTKAVVRVFLGPKYDEYGRKMNINENRMNFVELDQFFHQLTTGQNVIERNSHQTLYAQDRTTIKHLTEKFNKYMVQEQDVQMTGNDIHYTFPKRCMLPKGHEEGQTYQIFVMVSEYQPITQNNEQFVNNMKVQQSGNHVQNWQEEELNNLVGLGVQRLDAQALGYPLEKPIDTVVFESVSNAYVTDVKIYHKNVEDIMSTTGEETYMMRQIKKH